MKNFISLFAICVLLSTSLTNCTRITANERGFKYDNSGSKKGIPEIIPAYGFIGYVPVWTVVVAFPTQLQHIAWTDDVNESSSKTDEHIEIACKGGAILKVNVGFNYTINPDSVRHIYFKFYTDDLDVITKGFLRTKVRAAMQEISGRMTLDSMFNNLPEYESIVRETLIDTLSKDGFNLETFTLTHAPVPTDNKLIEAMSKKNAEKQLADQAIYTKIKNENLSQANVATARGDSAVSVINAQGEAKAIREKQLVLTPEYIEYVKWSKWDGALPTTSLGAGTSMIYSPK